MVDTHAVLVFVSSYESIQSELSHELTDELQPGYMDV